MSRLLIVNADDLGYDPAIDRGIFKAARDGIVTSATVMVTTEFVAHAVAEALSIPGLGLGLHLNFARGPSLSGAPSLLGATGELHEAGVTRFAPRDVFQEAESQLRRFIELLGREPTHFDVHKHLHRNPNVQQAVLELARQRRLPLRATDVNMRLGIRAAGVTTTDHFIGDTGARAYWTSANLLAAMEALAEGTTELMCHPGYRPERTPTGYGIQREGELAALTAPEVVARAARGDFVLTSFASMSPGASPR